MSLLVSRIARPIVEDPGRSIGWWGAVIGLIALAHLVGGILVAAVYIRAASASWPPQPGSAPGMELSGIAVALTIAAAAVTSLGGRRVGGGRSLGDVALVGAAVLALVAAGLRGSVTIFSAWPVTEHAFWSVRWVLGAMDVVLLTTFAIIASLAGLHVRRDVVRPGEHAELAIVSLWAWVTAAFVLAGWLVAMSTMVWWG